MKMLRPRSQKAGFTLVEIMIVVLIIGILLAIAIPNFVAAREASRAKACVANLKQIDSATQQWCMDKQKNSTNYSTGPVIGTDLVKTDGTGYLRSTPTCPSGGVETVASSIGANPFCTISSKADGTASTTGTGDYAPGGTPPNKFYHGLQ